MHSSKVRVQQTTDLEQIVSMVNNNTTLRIQQCAYIARSPSQYTNTYDNQVIKVSVPS